MADLPGPGGAPGRRQSGPEAVRAGAGGRGQSEQPGNVRPFLAVTPIDFLRTVDAVIAAERTGRPSPDDAPAGFRTGMQETRGVPGCGVPLAARPSVHKARACGARDGPSVAGDAAIRHVDPPVGGHRAEHPAIMGDE